MNSPDLNTPDNALYRNKVISATVKIFRKLEEELKTNPNQILELISQEDVLLHLLNLESITYPQQVFYPDLSLQTFLMNNNTISEEEIFIRAKDLILERLKFLLNELLDGVNYDPLYRADAFSGKLLRRYISNKMRSQGITEAEFMESCLKTSQKNLNLAYYIDFFQRETYK